MITTATTPSTAPSTTPLKTTKSATKLSLDAPFVFFKSSVLPMFSVFSMSFIVSMSATLGLRPLLSSSKLSSLKAPIVALLLCFVAMFAFSTTAQAAANTISDDSIGYIGVRGGMTALHDTNTKSISDPMAYGVYLSYKFNREFGVELDYTTSKEVSVTNSSNQRGMYDVTRYGTYLTYHYPIGDSDFYAKSKLGVGGAEINERYGSDTRSADDIGIAGGLGVGMFLQKNVALEAELNTLQSDHIKANTMTLGVQVHF